MRHGTEEEQIEVSADEVLKAIAEEREIDIQWAVIKGDLDIQKIKDRIVVLSARPGRVHHIETVTLPRPRTSDTRLAEELLAIKRKLWHMLEH